MNRLQVATFTEPLALQAGDELEQVGQRLIVRRAGVVVYSILLGPISSDVTRPVVFGNLGQLEKFYWEKPPMSINVAHTRTQINDQTGQITLFFGDDSRTFDNWEEVRIFGYGIVTDENAFRLIAAMAYEASPDGANKTIMVGAQVSINPKAAVPIVFTPPNP